MRIYFTLLLLAALVVPESGFAITRQQIYSNAYAYVNQSWTMAEANRFDGANACTDSNRIRTPFPVSSTPVRGVAYCWGGGHSVRDFLDGIAGTGYAGNNCTSSDNPAYLNFISGTYGVDCSGLVTRAWGRNEPHLGTRQLPGVSRAIPEIAAARRGDIFNKDGLHTAILVSFQSNGLPLIIESSSTGWNVAQRSRTWGYFNGYTALISNDVTDNVGGDVRVDTGVTISPATPTQGQTATCSFKLREVYGAPITLGRVNCAVVDASSGQTVFNFPASDNVTVAAGGTWQYSAQLSLVPGSYLAVARILTTSSTNAGTIGAGVNPRSFTVASGPTTYTLSVTTSGSGTVTGPQIDCGIHCTGEYTSGTTVELTPRPSGSTFTRWEGACSGAGSCILSMSENRSVRAVFTNTPGLAAPSGLTATTASTSQINLTWADNSNNETGFRIERKMGSGGSWSEIATPGESVGTYQDTGLAASTQYFYRVRAYNSSGSSVVYSGYSNETSATTSGTTSTQELRVTKAGNGSGTVTSEPAGINCAPPCTASFANGQPVTLRATATSGAFTGWSGDCTGATCSVTMSGPKTVTATFTIPAALNAPSALTASPPAGPRNTEMVLTWVNNSSGQTGFKVERGLASGSGINWTQIGGTTAANATSYRDFGLDFARTYFYRVRASNSSGDSEYSNQAGASTSGAFLIWPVPTHPGTASAPTVSQPYAGFNDGAAGKHHTGLDIAAPAETEVVAAAGGVARVWRLNVEGSSHCLGNVVMIRHSAQSRSTLYAHLKTINISDGDSVVQGQRIGIVGAEVGPGCIAVGTHLHFELKNQSFLGTTGDNTGPYGYTPGAAADPIPANAPGSFGFYNPIPGFGEVEATPDATVTVTTDGNGVGMRVGPNRTYTGTGNTLVAATPYIRVGRAGAATDQCDNGWLELKNSSGAYFPNGGYPPYRNGPASVPTVWACKGNAGVTYLQEGTPPPNYTLTISRIPSSTGTGRVSSTPAGINNCSTTTCSANFPSGSVMLTATPDGGSTFGSWTGCTSMSGNTCSVTLNGNRNLTVSFNSSPQTRTLTVSKTGSGGTSGTVMSNPGGISCGGTCSAGFELNSSVTLTASGGSSSTFSSWGSGCASTNGNTCVVSMTSDKTIGATFTSNPGPVQRITNPSFTNGKTSWQLSGDFWAGTNLSYPYSPPGYAAGGVDSTGQSKDSASGSMYQSFSVPANATTADLSVRINVTSEETSTSTAFDSLYVTLQDSAGNVRTTITTRSNLHKRSSKTDYSEFRLNLLPYKGLSLRVHFRATTDPSYKTTFRIDDVSVMADGN